MGGGGVFFSEAAQESMEPGEAKAMEAKVSAESKVAVMRIPVSFRDRDGRGRGTAPVLKRYNGLVGLSMGKKKKGRSSGPRMDAVPNVCQSDPANDFRNLDELYEIPGPVCFSEQLCDVKPEFRRTGAAKAKKPGQL